MTMLLTFTRFLYDAFNVSYLLLFLLLWLAWRLIKLSEDPASVWVNVFNDEAGKRSALRVATLIALMIHSAVLLYVVTATLTIQQTSVADALDRLLYHVLVYAGVWSGAPVAAKFFDMIAAKVAPK